MHVCPGIALKDLVHKGLRLRSQNQFSNNLRSSKYERNLSNFFYLRNKKRANLKDFLNSSLSETALNFYSLKLHFIKKGSVKHKSKILKWFDKSELPRF